MNNEATVELASYSDRFEAETIKIRLAAAGIQSEVFGTDAASAFGMGGAPQTKSVRVEVAGDDIARATKILEQDRRDAIARGPWVCDECSETNEATFDLCWKCNSPPEPVTQRQHDQSLRRDPGPVTIDEPSLRSKLPNDNPYRPVLVNEAAHATNHSDVKSSSRVDERMDPQLLADVTRAFHSAVVGWLVLPPLMSIYSIYRLLRLPTIIPRNRSLRRKVLVAWFVNFVAIVLWPIFWLQIAFG
jgi:hypothetical protein